MKLLPSLLLGGFFRLANSPLFNDKRHFFGDFHFIPSNQTGLSQFEFLGLVSKL